MKISTRLFLGFLAVIFLTTILVSMNIFNLAVVILFALVIAFAISKSISNQIIKLKDAAIEIGKGELDTRVTINSKDEIGFLAASFNKMGEDLRVSIQREKELAAAGGETDHKRAAELEKAYSDLEYSKEELERNKRIIELAYEKLKTTQEQLVQAGKMAAVGQLGAGVAHELNTPIGVILNYSQILQGEIKKKSPETDKMKRASATIEKECKRCKEIISNLLTFSRQTKPEQVEPTSINEVVENTLDLIERQLTHQNIKLVKSLSKGLPKTQGNRVQLQQVFTNIVLNAQQAMPDGGSLTVSTGFKEKGLTLGDEKYDSIEVSFADTGCGIPKESLGRIYEPFFTDKKVWISIGLGLSISYSIIEAHEGIIHVESEEGKGSKFTVVLPVRPR